MSRRKEPLLALLGRLPWWVGVGLAVVSYIGFSTLAARPAPPLGPGAAVAAVWTGGARALQWVAPIFFLAGAVLSVIGRRIRTRLLVDGRDGGHRAVQGMTWQQFELLIGEAFRQQGYTVTERGGAEPDGGVDLMLTRAGKRGIVQCKQWRSVKVGLPVVRELLGSMTAESAAHGWVITSGRFTAEAEAFARQHGIQLIDGDVLPGLLRKAGSAMPTMPLRPSSSTASSGASAPPLRPASDTPPSCPTCGKSLVRRVARTGARAGEPFWGCSSYPACKGTRPIG